MLTMNDRTDRTFRMMLRTLTASGLVFTGVTMSAIADDDHRGFGDDRREVIPGRYIVLLKDGEGPARDLPAPAIEAFARRPGVKTHHVYSHAAKGFAADLTDEALETLKRDPRVAYIEQDQIVWIDQRRPGGGGSSGGSTSSQINPWGIARIGLGTPLAGPVNVDVAVIDTGIQTNHPDLTVVGGANFTGGSTTAYADANGHGTHVAGTVAAKNNTVGVVGVAPGARLWAVKVLGSTGSGTVSAVIAGVDWVTANASTIEVANMSLSTSNSTTLKAALDRAVAAGVTITVSAGNASTDTRNYSPANSVNTGVITVSSMNSSSIMASTSNSGLNYADDSGVENGVDVIAPGEAVISTYINSGYASMSGTSMAAPHVAGAAALCKVANPEYSPADVKQAIMMSPPTGFWNVGAAGIFGLTPWRATSGDRDGFYEPLINAAAFVD